MRNEPISHCLHLCQDKNPKEGAGQSSELLWFFPESPRAPAQGQELLLPTEFQTGGASSTGRNELGFLQGEREELELHLLLLVVIGDIKEVPPVRKV